MVAMLSAIINGHTDYAVYATRHYSVVFVKFLAASALHLMLYPEVARSMELMKYILNHNEHFTNPNVAFAIAFTAHHVNILAEVLNLYILLY